MGESPQAQRDCDGSGKKKETKKHHPSYRQTGKTTDDEDGWMGVDGCCIMSGCQGHQRNSRRAARVLQSSHSAHSYYADSLPSSTLPLFFLPPLFAANQSINQSCLIFRLVLFLLFPTTTKDTAMRDYSPPRKHLQHTYNTYIFSPSATF